MSKVKFQIRTAVIVEWHSRGKKGIAVAFDGDPKARVLVEASRFHGSDGGRETLQRNDWRELVNSRILFVPPLDGDWDTLVWAFDGPKNRESLERWIVAEEKRIEDARVKARLPKLDVKKFLNPRDIFVEPARSRRQPVAVAG